MLALLEGHSLGARLFQVSDSPAPLPQIQLATAERSRLLSPHFWVVLVALRELVIGGF